MYKGECKNVAFVMPATTYSPTHFRVQYNAAQRGLTSAPRNASCHRARFDNVSRPARLNAWKFTSTPRPSPACTNWLKRPGGQPMIWLRMQWLATWRNSHSFDPQSIADTTISRVGG